MRWKKAFDIIVSRRKEGKNLVEYKKNTTLDSSDNVKSATTHGPLRLKRPFTCPNKRTSQPLRETYSRNSSDPTIHSTYSTQCVSHYIN